MRCRRTYVLKNTRRKEWGEINNTKSLLLYTVLYLTKLQYTRSILKSHRNCVIIHFSGIGNIKNVLLHLIYRIITKLSVKIDFSLMNGDVTGLGYTRIITLYFYYHIPLKGEIKKKKR